MKFEIKNRFTGIVQFECELSATFETENASVQLGAAIKLAVKARANLARANLARANLAGADLAGADLAGANLARANLAGADLAGANLARADLAGAYLAGADLAGADLAGANLADANLAGANLAGANLARANLARAYLAGANLAGANLAGADLAGAKNVPDLSVALKIEPSEIPVIPQIDAVILKAIEDGGKLDMSTWHGPNDHWCGTTHCRAGWAIHFGGKKGKALQDKYGEQLAGTLIYQASRPGIPAPHFFAKDQDALADIRKCAAEQLQTK